MKYSLAAWLGPLVFCSATPAWSPKDAGHPVQGKVQLGGESYRFHPEKLMLSAPHQGQQGKRLFRLSGRLVPASGEPIHLEMTAVEDGRIYMLKLARRRAKGGIEDVWAATLKTKVEVLELRPDPGGKLRLRISGPLAATLKDGGSQTNWSGEIQAAFDVVSD